MHRITPLILALIMPLALVAQEKPKPKTPKKPKPGAESKEKAPKPERDWAPYVEPDFPFISSVLDARDLGEGWHKDNLTPRGIIINVGHGIHACFDTDLLRVSLVWQADDKGNFITLNAMAPGSYLNPGQKTAEGENNVPKPIGTPWLANGIYPGWSVGSEPSFADPREPAPSKEEVGRGGLVGETQLLAVRNEERGVSIDYRIAGTQITEWLGLGAEGSVNLTRWFKLAPHAKPFTLVLGETGSAGESKDQPLVMQFDVAIDGEDEWEAKPQKSATGCWFITVPASAKAQSFGMAIYPAKASKGKTDDEVSETVGHPGEPTSKAHWPATVKTTTKLSPDKQSAYVMDDIALPLDNPWKRSVRFADIAFLDDKGHAAAVTMDGDVWMISGLIGDLKNIEWKRFTSGLHEPMSIVARPTTANPAIQKRAAELSAGLRKLTTTDGISLPPKLIADLTQKAEQLSKLGGNQMELAKVKQQLSDLAQLQATEDKAGKQASLILHELKGLEAAAATELPFSPDLFVFDRNGVWRLRDTNNDGEADTHEMFCNRFAQTAETREFPSSMKLAPDGSFYISKGGQQGSHLGKDNGKVLHISADGQSVETVAYGLRQPFIGVHPHTGLVTASDQQGNYVPSTPLHIIRGGQYYGFLTTLTDKEKYPAAIADPLTWIPHPVNPSGYTQVWLCDSKMGPLNDALVHIAYSRPEIFRVMPDKRHGDWTQPSVGQASSLSASDKKQAGSLSHAEQPQAAVCNIPISMPPSKVKNALPVLPFAPLNGHVNPADGMLYLVGFQIWGSIAERTSGLARIRYTGAQSLLPNDVAVMKNGVLVRFDCAVDKASASNPDNYNVERWNYKRTFDYGSPHFRLDGTTGQELQTVSSAYVSADGHSVFLGIPDMKKCDQVHVGWSIKSSDGQAMAHNAYLTPWNLATFDSAKEGFGTLQPDVTPRKAAAIAAVKPSVEEGQRLYQFIGCMGCHSVDGSVAGRLGPSWKGLFGSTRELSDDTKVVADEAFIRESIIDPSKKKAKAYLKLETGMPIYAGILNEGQISSIILYMKTLK